MGKASLYECCVAVNKAQKIQKSIIPIRFTINDIWPPFMINVGRMPKNTARELLNKCYGLAANHEEYRKRVKDEFGIK